jgi:type I restriction enzyme R subunit
MYLQSYLEKDFEDDIEECLLNSGYQKRFSKNYNKDLCFITDEVILFIRSTQPKEYEELEKQYGTETRSRLCSRLYQEISKKGTLHILQKGFEYSGINFKFTYFKSNNETNQEYKILYEKNRFIIIRQLRYSQVNGKSLDMVIFLNGLPIITSELKNVITGQLVEREGIKQYKEDRDPREPIFERCLIHFAVGNEKVYMTTKLDGSNTIFIPFNENIENHVVSNRHRTSYLWEDIFQPDTLLDIINNGKISNITIGISQYIEDEKNLNSDIIKILELNDLNITEKDKKCIELIKIKIENNKKLQSEINFDNISENTKYIFDKVVDELLKVLFIYNNIELYKKLMNHKVNSLLKQKWLEWLEKYYKIMEVKNEKN